MSFCIYRHTNTCRCCFFKSKKDDRYCSLHINNKSIVYDIIYDAIGRQDIKLQQDIYLIFKYIFDNPDLYTKELIFKKIIASLFIKRSKLFSIFNYYISNTYYITTDKIIDIIYHLHLNTYKFHHLHKLNIIKRFCHKCIIHNHIYNPNYHITNQTDPFTLDNINDLEHHDKFIYNDGANIYCFKPIELNHFIKSGSNWNPYTKLEFDYKTIRNLSIFIKYFNLNKSQDYQWTSIRQAYTDASYALEKMGFYNNCEWFLQLNPKQIKNIIRLFKLISFNIYNYNEFFNNLDENNIYFDFSKNIIHLFSNGNVNFLLCCNFMKALSVYNNDFYNSLPAWISDIETPIIIIDRNMHMNMNSNSNIELQYLINIIEN
jgi:hypothetical protein